METRTTTAISALLRGRKCAFSKFWFKHAKNHPEKSLEADAKKRGIVVSLSADHNLVTVRWDGKNSTNTYAAEFIAPFGDLPISRKNYL